MAKLRVVSKWSDSLKHETRLTQLEIECHKVLCRFTSVMPSRVNYGSSSTLWHHQRVVWCGVVRRYEYSSIHWVGALSNITISLEWIVNFYRVLSMVVRVVIVHLSHFSWIFNDEFLSIRVSVWMRDWQTFNVGNFISFMLIIIVWFSRVSLTIVFVFI